MATTEILRIREKHQIVIPLTVRKKMHCEVGDLLEATVKNNAIVLKPVKTIPKDQAWFWSKSWQEKERESQADYDAGRIKKFNSMKELIKDLHK